MPRVLWFTNLVLLALLAAAWLAVDWRWVPPAALPPELGALAQPTSGGAPVPLDVAHARPLFATDRRPAPPAPEPVVVEPEAPAPDHWASARLRAVMGAGASGAVLLDYQGRPRRVAVGQVVEGWRLVRIDGFEVAFENDAGEVRKLRIQRAQTAVARPVGAAPTPVAAVREANLTESQPPAAPTPVQAVATPTPAEFHQNQANLVAERRARRAAAEAAFRQWQQDSGDAPR